MASPQIQSLSINIGSLIIEINATKNGKEIKNIKLSGSANKIWNSEDDIGSIVDFLRTDRGENLLDKLKSIIEGISEEDQKSIISTCLPEVAMSSIPPTSGGINQLLINS